MKSNDKEAGSAAGLPTIRRVENLLYRLSRHIQDSDLLAPVRQAQYVLADMEQEGAIDEPEYVELHEAIDCFEHALERLHAATDKAHHVTWDLVPADDPPESC